MHHTPIRVRIIIIIIVLTHAGTAMAAKLNPRFEMEAGFKTVFSSQASDNWIYYKPFISIGCGTDYFDINAGYAGNLNYRIFDQDGEYKDIVMHDASVDLEIQPVADFYAGFDFKYSAGESSYSGTEYVLNAGYDFSKVSIFGEFSYSLWGYDLNGSSIHNTSYDIYLEAAYYIRETLSIELSYDYLDYESADLGVDIRKNVFRPGIVAGIKEIAYILGGFSLGWESDSFVAGCDAGINIYPWKYFKISVLYVFSYNMDLTPDSDDETTSYLPGGSYDSHRLVAGVSFLIR